MFSTWLGVVLLFAFFGLLVWVIVAASPRGNTYEKKRAKARLEKVAATQQESLTALTTYGWVDKSKGVARIPITDAMKLTVAELAQKKPAAANSIAPPEQSPAPATSPAASPSASPAASVGTTPKPTSVTGPDSESRNQPAAAIVPPPAPPGTQPGPGTTPAASPPSAAVKPPASPAASASPSAPATPLPVRGKTP
ncbi:MAG: hypothetical protein QOJ45_178 [Verrucomicrobiota bacterium]|jgi:hypothetical protein